MRRSSEASSKEKAAAKQNPAKTKPKPTQQQEEVKQEEVKQEEAKQEEVKQELTTSHPDMCDSTLFGTFDPNADSCKECFKDFPECGAACKALADSRKITPTATRTTRARGASTRGGSIVLISSANSGGGKIDQALMRPEGASMEELKAIRGAIPAHLAALKNAGFNIEHENGRYYYRPNKPAQPTEGE